MTDAHQPHDTITGSQIRRARAMLNWRPSELAQKAQVSRSTIERAEQVNGMPEIDPASAAALRAAFESAGLEFTDGDAPGVRMRKAGTAPAPDLSPSERQTLRHIAECELAASEMDWVALQALRRMGLAEETLGAGWKLTKEGRRALQALARS